MHKNQILKLFISVSLFFTFVNNEAQTVEKSLKQETSEYFSMTVNGAPVVVNQAASSYSFVNIDVSHPVEVVITALKPDFWKKGVEILPLRFGLRPIVEGNSIRFSMNHAEKLCISQPGNYYLNAPLLFLFGNELPSALPSQKEKTVRYYKKGIYHEDIHVKSNETICLEDGAVVYGSLNFWDVTNAHVYGKGVVIHEGPQNPDTDEGWQHRPNWHGITAHNSNNITVKGITVLVRSRTWMIQLQGCKDMIFENIKVIGGTHGNANQDGIDWLGCGNTIVRNCFFRCSDDIFAIYGNTGFYDEAVSIPGLDVENILIEGCVLSTSISNVMRIGWPRKVFNSKNIVMRNCDVIHAGQGGCVVPFALAEFWSDPDGKGVHSDYVFDDIRLDNLYSITQLLQSKNGSGSVKNIQFKNIRTLTPPLVNSAIEGICSEISFENIKLGDYTVDRLSSLGLDDTSSSAKIVNSILPKANFQYDTGLLKPGQTITFDARSSVSTASISVYSWNLGDGTIEKGEVIHYKFNDTYGTRMDNSGQFQVQLTITDENGKQDAMVRPVVIGTAIEPASKNNLKQNGLNYRQYSGVKTNWTDILQSTPNETGMATTFRKNNLSQTPCTIFFDGYLDVPVSGGYTFYIMARDGAFLQLDSTVLVNSNEVKPQVCNTLGNTVQQHTGIAILEGGQHKISFGYKHDLGNEAFTLYWQGPNNKLEEIPISRFFRSNRY